MSLTLTLTAWFFMNMIRTISKVSAVVFEQVNVYWAKRFM